MKKFCIITNKDKDKDYSLAVEIEQLLGELGAGCVVLPNEAVITSGRESFTQVEKIPADTQCAIVLGGDGTMIQAANDLLHTGIPILGVNIGTLGFLTEVERQNLLPSLGQLVAGDYGVENRILLKGQIHRADALEDAGYALNDFVVSKRGMCRLISVDVYINDEWVDRYRADGLIAATPTGSTGYNLSAGGPVLAPSIHSLVITPICAHSLNKRSLVVSAGDSLRFEIGKSKEIAVDEAAVFADGRVLAPLESGDYIELTVPKEESRFVKLTKVSFFEKMRGKLNGE